MKRLMAVVACCTWLTVPSSSAKEPTFEFDRGVSQRNDPFNLVTKTEGEALPAPESKDSLGIALISALSACSPEVRATFLSKLEFRDQKLVTVYDEDTEGCVSERQMQRLTERLSNSQKESIRGRCASASNCHTRAKAWCTDNCNSEGSKEPATPAPLFDGCSPAVRKEFFSRLTFRDGELAGMYLGGIKRCGGEKDLDVFLSVFDQGLKSSWIKEHECSSRATCTELKDNSCNTKTC